MRQVADNTYQLGGRGHNFYLVVSDGSVTMIDTGCSREWRKLVGALDSLGLRPEDVSGVIATHAHSDHFGLAKKAHSEGLRVAVHEEESDRARGTYRGRFAVAAGELPMLRIHAIRNFLPMILAGVMQLEHLPEVVTFGDNERLDLPGNPVAIHTPGHTEGHAMFLCEDAGLLFTGDGLATMDLLGPSQGPQMLDDRFHLDTAQALASLDRIAHLDADLILPGHGPAWSTSPAEAVAAVRS